VPDEADLAASRIPKGPQLPKVTVNSSRDEIKRAFEAVSKVEVPGRDGSSNSSTSAAASNSSSSHARHKSEVVTGVSAIGPGSSTSSSDDST